MDKFEFANQATEEFYEYFAEEIHDFYNLAGDITRELIDSLILSRGRYLIDDCWSVSVSSIRDYLDERAEVTFYERMEAMEGVL
jgi:hypothetical protein